MLPVSTSILTLRQLVTPSKPPLTVSEGASNIRPSQTGTKRLFSDRVSQLINSQDRDENDPPISTADEIHTEKRSRGSDWPLRTSSLAPEPEPRLNDAGHPVDRSPERESRFLEGSMNGRVSKMPPPEFTGEESQRENRRSRVKSKTAQPASSSGSTAEKADTARHSGIYRFGKSVVGTFNPANWKLLWTKPPQADETPQEKALRERQEKAERIYQELKESGSFRDATTARPSFRIPEPEKHDSGISITTPVGVTPNAEKRYGRIFLDPPSPAKSRPSSIRSLRKRPDAPRRAPSSQDLRKHRRLAKRVSDLEDRLAAARQQLLDAMPPPPVPALPVSPATMLSPGSVLSPASVVSQTPVLVPSTPVLSPGPVLSTPSQPVLEPRVARRSFVPGALATLPSERLLSGYLAAEEDGDVKEVKKEVKKVVKKGVKNEVKKKEIIGRAVSTEGEDGFEWPDYVF